MVKKVIINIDHSKVSGPDYITVLVLGNSEPELSYILAKLFGMCLRKSCVTDYLKFSSVVPIFKNIGDRSTAKNYCSVSLVGLWFIISLYKLVNNRFGDPLKK